MMRKHFVAVLLLAPGVLGLSAATPPEKRPAPEASSGQRLEIPDIIPTTSDSESSSHPWISGAALADAAGFTIDTEYLNRRFFRGIGDDVAAANKQGIAAFNAGTEPPLPIFVTWYESYPHIENPPSTLQQLVDSAAFVAVGVVEESVGGFSYGYPGNLLRVRVEQWSGRDEIPAQEEILLFWVGGEINIGHATILASLNGSPQPPRVGETLVLFPELGVEARRFFSFQGRSGNGAAAKFSHLGMQVTGGLARQIPALGRAGSFSDFSAQLDVAIARSPLR